MRSVKVRYNQKTKRTSPRPRMLRSSSDWSCMITNVGRKKAYFRFTISLYRSITRFYASIIRLGVKPFPRFLARTQTAIICLAVRNAPVTSLW